VLRSPAGPAAPDPQADAALVGELDRVGQQVLQDLLQALGSSVTMLPGTGGSTDDRELQALVRLSGRNGRST
jgi:hypothetical protein